MDWAHRDPFDRLLAAASILEAATLVSADTGFANAPDVRWVW
jgi:PIN domain nuclease of toxin-antitoxin system